MPDRGRRNAISDQQNILIVDDDASILETLREGLSQRGYLCETAVNATSAIEQMRTRYFHAMVIDINLPDMNGMQLTGRVKQMNPDAAVILVTGFLDEFSYDDAVRAGASDFIKKPFGVKELIVRIEHARKHETLFKLSLHDDLTGLYNRRGFFTLAEHILKQAKRNQQGLFMLYADLNGLKGINDILGHQQGDWALIDIANIFREICRESDIIARIGGDEFVIMPIGENVDSVIDRLHKAIERDNLKKRDYRLSISTGIAYFNPWAPCTIDELLSKADKSMYRQKKKEHTA